MYSNVPQNEPWYDHVLIRTLNPALREEGKLVKRRQRGKKSPAGQLTFHADYYRFFAKVPFYLIQFLMYYLILFLLHTQGSSPLRVQRGMLDVSQVPSAGARLQPVHLQVPQ